MEDFFDDFENEFDGDSLDDDSCEDHYDDGMEDSADPDPEDGKSDELSWDEAYWSGVGLGFDPPQYLKPGDVVDLKIDFLGSSRQEAVAFPD